MPRFFFRGEDASGRVVTGAVEANDRQAARGQLESRLSKLSHLTQVPSSAAPPAPAPTAPPVPAPSTAPKRDLAQRLGMLLLGVGLLTSLLGLSRPTPPKVQESRSRVRVQGRLSRAALDTLEARVHLAEIPRDEFRRGPQQLGANSAGDFSIDFEVLSPRPPTRCTLVLSSPQGQAHLNGIPLSQGSDGALVAQLGEVHLAPVQQVVPAGPPAQWQSFERKAPQRSAPPPASVGRP